MRILYQLRNVRSGHTIGGYLTALLAAALCACSPQALTTTTTAHATSDPRPYIIGPDDLLDIIVWRQTQLSGKIPVEEDGSIAVPLAGRVPAAGLTCPMLEKLLRDKLAPFTDDPRVTVRVADPRSKVFYVVGEVTKPGVMRLNSGEVLSQGLAEAGGFTDFANRRAIRIIRRQPTENVKMTINYIKIEQGDLTADIPLEPGDTITVP
jgi:polysaccharide biosynthesis/export protein